MRFTKGFTILGLCALSLFANSAEKLELIGVKTQGSLLRGSLPAGSVLTLDGKPVNLNSEGEFALGFGRDAELNHTLSWQLPNGDSHSQALILNSRSYDIQRIDGLAQNMVSPPQSVLDRISKDAAQVRKARQPNTDVGYFMQTFIWPAEGPITGVYGSQRVLNGQPKRPHYGVDVGAPTGTDVIAPAAGIVRLAEKDLYYSGGTVIIDHGLGVSSTFLHMSAVDVEEGQVLAQGQHVGAIGATGRATGPHLDWRINWFGERLDPALLVPPRN